MATKFTIGFWAAAIGIPMVLIGMALLSFRVWHANVTAPPYTPAYSATPAVAAAVPTPAWRRVATFDSGLIEAEWLCAEEPDRVWVGSADRAVALDAAGRILTQRALPAGARAMAVDPARSCCYVALTDRVAVVSAAGLKIGEWVPPGDRTLLTSVAIDAHSLYAADAGQRIVWRFDRETGAVTGRLGGRDPERDIPGFILPSPYFPLAMAPDGLLRVANTGRHSIEAYTAEGDLETRWGEASWAVEGFVGCCNPAGLAIARDGRFVTSEKGIRRIKVYDERGRFEALVAAGDELADPASSDSRPCPVAVAPGAEGAGWRIWALIPGTGRIQVFEPREDRLVSRESAAPAAPNPGERSAVEK